jgi:hypothetical protein
MTPVWRGDDPVVFAAAMESLAASSLAPSEILICQDGAVSAPLDEAIGTAVAMLGARRLIHDGPRGLHHNLNSAMTAVRTPYVARFDADDLNLPVRFEIQTAFARADPAVAAFGGAIIEFWPDGRRRRKAMPDSHEAIVRFARWRNPINHMTAFFRTDAFLEAGGYPDVPLKEDYALWLAMLARGARLANVTADLVHARLGHDFHRRRAGLRNIASEVALHRLKRNAPGVGGPEAAMALIARSVALAGTGTARLAYELALRR